MASDIFVLGLVIVVLAALFAAWKMSEWLDREASQPKTDPKPLKCRLGLHEWSTERAKFNRADQCRNCHVYNGETAGERLNYERRLWEELGGDFDDHAIAMIISQKLAEWDEAKESEGI